VGQGRPMTWRPCPLLFLLCPDNPSHNHLPLLLKRHFQNKLQGVNLRNFRLGQTNLDKLRDGFVGAQVPEGHT